MAIELTNENFIMYAIKNYDNPSCAGLREFNDDLKRLRYVKRLLGRYQTTGEVKERLVINHIVVLYNVFGAEAASHMLFFKINERFWPALKTFLVFLNLMPRQLQIRGRRINESDIALDNNIIGLLRQL